MARLAGVDLPREKRIEIGLTYIYGIGLTLMTKYKQLEMQWKVIQLKVTYVEKLL